jgi:chromate transporter
VEKVLEVFWIFLRLGLTSFGGPIAHLSYFHNEFVTKRKWFDDHAYADIVALCQFLPGPASSQVGISIGLSRAGVLGAVAAWLGFTLPSAIALVLFAMGVSKYGSHLGIGWLHGLKIVAVAVVIQAVWVMSRSLTPDRLRVVIAFIAAAICLVVVSPFVQIGVILLGAVLGLVLIKNVKALPPQTMNFRISPSLGFISLAIFIMLLFVLPLGATFNPVIKVFDSFYRVGALVFGGGHVVLPLLQTEVVRSGWVSSDAFMAGYGITQAMPGPLFTFAGYLGAISNFGPSGVTGAVLSLIAIFLPSFLMIFAAVPFWGNIRRNRSMRLAIAGVNAVVVGILMAALYNPIWVSAIYGWKDFALMILCLILLMRVKVPPWIVVAFGAIVGGFVS